MSGGEVRKVTRQDIQLVQNLVEACLTQYMRPKEVVFALLHMAKIEPGFTELVWQQLEEENQEFFKAYYLRLVVKDQISRFNDLLEEQAKKMNKELATRVASIPMSNGSLVPSLDQNSAIHPTQHIGRANPENMQQPVNRNIHDPYSSSSLHPYWQNNVNIPAHTRMVDMSSDIQLAQTSNMGLIQGWNGGMLKSDAGCVGNPAFMFGCDSNVLDTCNTIGEAPVSSFTPVESNFQHLNMAVLQPDTFSPGHLRQIPHGFSLSDLTADFSQSSDVLEKYSRSPFIETDTGNFF